jgi:hypothetical protein
VGKKLGVYVKGHKRGDGRRIVLEPRIEGKE